jgi:3D (Asp-Asp-Asp) domain-containing protein
LTLLAFLALSLVVWTNPAFRPTDPADYCEPIGHYRITGYTKTGGNPHTYDGTSVWTSEKIVAASWNIPIGTQIRVAGLDYTYRVADRGGGLEARHIDVLVDSVATAYKIEEWVGGKYAAVCVVSWGSK